MQHIKIATKCLGQTLNDISGECPHLSTKLGTIYFIHRRRWCCLVVSVLVLACIHVRGFEVKPKTKTWYARSARFATNVPSSKTALVSTDLFEREEAQNFMDNNIFPAETYSERVGWGRDAQGLNDDGPLRPDDPRLSQTYAEFPLSSFDELLDRSILYLDRSKLGEQGELNSQSTATTIVDVGSGCGRIALYAAISRKSSLPGLVHVHGIEIATLLHEKALQAMEQSVIAALLRPAESITDSSSCQTESENQANSISLHLGSAMEHHGDVLAQADIIFMYSTAFSARTFSPESSALLLDPEWSEALSRACSSGCVAITTDRALDSQFGWELVERLDVENPEVWGSTGYIHVLREKRNE